MSWSAPQVRKQNSRRRLRDAAIVGVAAAFAFALPSARAGLDETPEDRIPALIEQGRAYEHGEGVPRNVSRAVDLYCEAARLGNAEAQFDLGWIYANGRGVPRNDALASLFFEMAAGQGHVYAEKMLAYVGPPAEELPECMRDRTVFAVADPDLAILVDDDFMA